ncbi:response regulator [Ktedonosporobacter rubrisoli]|uniref:histidine kinase n=1 Tax=Ktedonosporobacter rubrisoli TaxID=2509675 RepID=A0A4P6JMD5_KTERU|nr:response regulator [Ktedonosporobacter rubrisoli]QBD76220.1 response regulator [Ktedonosporobacter rubrisoli]
MPTPRILLVDDDPGLLQALPRLITLRFPDIAVESVDSAQGALEHIHMQDYDAIVSDIKMPGMDGLELLTKIQELRIDTPTLLITGHADQELILQALRSGAYDFIQKPIERLYFVAALQRAIHTRQLRRQVREQQQALAQHAQFLEQLVERRTRELLAASEATEMLVRDMLDLSLIEANELQIHPTLCDLVEVCQQVLHAYTLGAGLELSFEAVQKSIPVEVDRDRISQVLINLLFAARKWSPRGSPIAILLQQTGDEAVISVHETEVDHNREDMPNYLAYFSQYEAADRQAHNVSDQGVGLYLAQKIVEQHGGRLEMQETTAGKGQTFSIVLPLASRESRQEQETPFQPPRWLIS